MTSTVARNFNDCTRINVGPPSTERSEKWRLGRLVCTFPLKLNMFVSERERHTSTYFDNEENSIISLLTWIYRLNYHIRGTSVGCGSFTNLDLHWWITDSSVSETTVVHKAPFLVTTEARRVSSFKARFPEIEWDNWLWTYGWQLRSGMYPPNHCRTLSQRRIYLEGNIWGTTDCSLNHDRMRSYHSRPQIEFAWSYRGTMVSYNRNQSQEKVPFYFERAELQYSRMVPASSLRGRLSFPFSMSYLSRTAYHKAVPEISYELRSTVFHTVPACTKRSEFSTINFNMFWSTQNAFFPFIDQDDSWQVKCHLTDSNYEI